MSPELETVLDATSGLSNLTLLIRYLDERGDNCVLSKVYD